MEQHLSKLNGDVNTVQTQMDVQRELTKPQKLQVQENLAQLQHDVEDLNQKLGTPTDWNQEMIRDCQRLQAENTQLGACVKALEEDCGNLKADKAQLESHLQEIQKQVQDMDELAQQTSQMQQAEAPPQVIQDETVVVFQSGKDVSQLSPRSRSSSRRSSKDDAEMVVVIAQLQEENNNLKRENRILKANLTEIEDSLKGHMESMQNEQNTQSKESEDKYKKVCQENQSLVQEIEDQHYELDLANSEKTRLETDHASTCRDLESLRERNHELCEDVDNLNKELDGVRGENERMAKEILLLKKAADKAEDLKLIKDENKKLREEVETLKDNNNQPSVVIKANMVEQLQQDKRELEEELKKAQGQKETEMRDEDLEALRKQHILIAQDRDRLAKENSQLQKDFQKLAKLLEEKHIFKDDADMPHGNLSASEYCARVREKIHEIKEIESHDRERMSRENKALHNEVEHLKGLLEKVNLPNGKEAKSPTESGRQQIVVLHKEPSSSERRYEELEQERDDLLSKLSSMNGGQSPREADDYKTMEKKCQRYEMDIDRLHGQLKELKRENKLMRRESRKLKESQTFDEIERLGTDNAKDINAEKERIKTEVNRLEMELMKRSLEGGPKSDEQTEEVQRQLRDLQQQVEVRS